MKRYLPIVLLSLTLAGCGMRANPIPRQRLTSETTERSPVAELLYKTYDNTLGNIEFIDRRVTRRRVFPVYKEVLDGNAPYLFEVVNEYTYDYRLTDLRDRGDLYFTFYEHQSFDYPLLILELVGPSGYHLFSIVQFFSDGSYATFGNLEASNASVLASNIYCDDEGVLYIDDTDGNQIFAINVVGGILKSNYGYSPNGKGFATALFRDGGINPKEVDGSEYFNYMAIDEGRMEPFNSEDYEKFKASLRPLERYPIDDDHFEDLSIRYVKGDLDGAKNIAKKPKEDKKKKVASGATKEEFQNFIDKNLNPYADGKFIFIDDFDNNGKLAAYVVTGGDKKSTKLVFIDETMEVHDVRDMGEGFFLFEDPKLLPAGDDAYVVVTVSGGGPGSTAYLYGVKDNRPYEPNLSGQIQHLSAEGDRFYQSETYLETTEIGGVRKERQIYYDYDQKSRQFIKSDGKEDGNATDPKKIGITINGADAGTIRSIKKDDVLYLNVDELNAKWVEHSKTLEIDPHFTTEELVESWTLFSPAEPSYPLDVWYFVSVPGFMQSFEAYFPEKNLIIDFFGAGTDIPGNVAKYMYPEHVPIVWDDALYMDLRTLLNYFPLDYTINDDGSIRMEEVDEVLFDDRKSISVEGYEEVHDFVKAKF